MRFFAWYWQQLKALSAPTESYDAGDVASWAARRAVARLMVLPLVLAGLGAGYLAWSAYDAYQRQSRLAASHCSAAVLQTVGLGGLDTRGSASTRLCHLRGTRGGTDVVEIDFGPGKAYTPKHAEFLEKWDWDRREVVTHQRVGQNERFVAERFDGGHLVVTVYDPDVDGAKVLLAYLGRE